MPKKILVVDDEPDINKIVVFRLKKAGYEVIQAYNGREALDMMKSTKPDLVLLDLIMPEIDGYEVCRIIKKDDGLRDIPVIIISADSPVGSPDIMKEKIKELNADDFLTKPYDPVELLKKVGEII